MAFFGVRVVDQPSETPTATFKEEAFNLRSQIFELTLRCHSLNCETIFFFEILVFQDPTKLQLIFKCFPSKVVHIKRCGSKVEYLLNMYSPLSVPCLVWRNKTKCCKTTISLRLLSLHLSYPLLPSIDILLSLQIR